jgi:hypothetical protein
VVEGPRLELLHCISHTLAPALTPSPPPITTQPYHPKPKSKPNPSNPPTHTQQVDDLGLDGVDMDYEPARLACKVKAGVLRCPSDKTFVAAASKLRAALPAGAYLMSIASFSTGCYGEPGGAFASSQPQSGESGISLALARSDAGKSLDLINVMAYDSGSFTQTGFDPKESFLAHKAAWPAAAIALGVEVRLWLGGGASCGPGAWCPTRRHLPPLPLASLAR